MNRKLNRGLKSFGEMISYFIPSSEGNGVASSQQEDRRLLMGEEALKGAGKFSLVCPGFAPSEHCASIPTFSQSLVTSGSLLFLMTLLASQSSLEVTHPLPQTFYLGHQKLWPEESPLFSSRPVLSLYL